MVKKIPFAEKKARILTKLTSVMDFALSQEKADWADILKKEIVHLEAEQLLLALAGTCKSGKSSTLNGLLLLGEISPVNAAVATNAWIQVAYGVEEKLVVYYLDQADHLQAERVKTREEIKDWVSEQGNPDNQRRVSRIDIFLPHPLLKPGLVLWDLPGLGGLNRKHSKVTYAALPLADGVLFVGSATDPLGPDILGEIPKIFKNTKNIFYVLTHSDRVLNADERLTEDLAKICEVLSLPDGAIFGCTISNSERMEGLLSGEAVNDADSGYDQLLDAIRQLLASKEKLILSRAIARTIQACQALGTPLSFKLRSREAQSQQEREAFLKQLNELLDRAKALSGGNARWIQELNEQIGRLEQDSMKELDLLFADLDSNLRRYLQMESMLQDPDELSSELTSDCSTGFHSILGTIRNRMQTIVVDIQELTNLGLNGGTTSLAGPGSISAQPDMAPRRESFISKVSDTGRSMTLNSMALGAVGSILGTGLGALGLALGTITLPILGPVAGLAALLGSAGALFGAVFGVGRGWKESKERELATLRNHYGAAARESLAKTRIELRYQLQTAMTEARRGLKEELLKGIAREEKVVTDSITEVKRAGEANRASSEAELRELRKLIQLLDQWLSQLNKDWQDFIEGPSAASDLPEDEEPTEDDEPAEEDGTKPVA